jgi:hypothetical protein
VLAILLVFGTVFVLTRGKGRPEPVAEQPLVAQEPAEASESADPTPAEPPAPRLQFAGVTDIALDPGTSRTVEIKLQRNGVEGPIQVQLEGLPDVVAAQPADVPEGEDTARIELTVAGETGGEEISKPVKLVATAGEHSADQELKVTVKKILPHRVVPPAALTLKPGAAATIDVAVERNGHQGPIQIRLEGLPEKVTAAVVEVPAEQKSAKVQLAAAADAKEAQTAVRVVAVLAERTSESQLRLNVERFPFKLAPLPVTSLQPGETKTIPLSVQRRSYAGPLKLTVEGLPEGVTAGPIEIAGGQTAGKLELAAAGDAHARVRSAEVVTTGGDVSTREPLVVRVSGEEGSNLPKDVTVDPELAKLLKRGSFGGRLEAASKQALLEIYGGTESSEQAVLRGLAWLARHQEKDGSWSLEKYHEGKEGCDCRLTMEAEIKEAGAAATAFGVLPFLGAGVTHKGGPDPTLAQYKTNVYNGLAHLMRNQVTSKSPTADGNLGGGMYAHALGTIALCEAYGLTDDVRIKVPAQKAVKYLVQAQHPTTGGWRYSPRQPGDTSVVGWVFLALRSGQLAGIQIDKAVLEKAGKFLDSCAAGPEAAKSSQYSYEPGGAAKLSLSAAGLLSRQYIGWKKDEPGLPEGQKHLMQNLPPESAARLGPIYYYYYATQVLHHMEGEEWDRWNHRMREHLISTQEPSGHQEGSWSPEGVDWGTRGGRLYSTSLALLTLEVYYRHLPLYRPAQKVQKL